MKNSQTILIVDDDPAHRLMLKKLSADGVTMFMRSMTVRKRSRKCGKMPSI